MCHVGGKRIEKMEKLGKINEQGRDISSISSIRDQIDPRPFNSDDSSLYTVFSEIEKMKECMIFFWKKTYLPEKHVV